MCKCATPSPEYIDRPVANHTFGAADYVAKEMKNKRNRQTDACTLHMHPVKSHLPKLVWLMLLLPLPLHIETDLIYYYILNYIHFERKTHKMILWHSIVSGVCGFDVHFARLFNFIPAAVALYTETPIKLGAAFNRIRMKLWKRWFIEPIKMYNSKMSACETSALEWR